MQKLSKNSEPQTYSYDVLTEWIVVYGAIKHNVYAQGLVHVNPLTSRFDERTFQVFTLQWTFLFQVECSCDSLSTVSGLLLRTHRCPANQSEAVERLITIVASHPWLSDYE